MALDHQDPHSIREVLLDYGNFLRERGGNKTRVKNYRQNQEFTALKA
jgi:hypothetical protein